MKKSSRWIVGGVLAVATSLFLYQIEAGWYGIGWNWLLLLIIVLTSFSLGFWGFE